MLDVYMLKNGKFQMIEEQMDIKKMMNEVLDMFVLQATSKSIELRIKMATGVPFAVVSDERRLKQVLINLISNALKFTNEGSITVEVEFDVATKKLSFNVIDTGIGIRKAD
jgi:signal transduction histidine kinase